MRRLGTAIAVAFFALAGAASAATLTASGATATYAAYAGDADVVADTVDCGSGNDRVTADAADVLVGCEEIHLPPAPPGPVDADGDGALGTIDCNDANAAIRPGAVEVRGNAIDEDCDGVAEPFPSLTVSVATGWLALTTFTRVTKLEVTAATGSHVELNCTAKKGCPFKKKAVTATKGRAGLTKALADAKLKPGTVLVLRVTSAGTIGRRYSWTIAKKKVPKAAVTPLPPGA